MGQGARKAGEALAAVLGGSASPTGNDAGRTLLLALVRLHELGALTFHIEDEAVHGPRPDSEPGAVVGFDPAQPGGTAHAYNMGSLSASDGGSQ